MGRQFHFWAFLLMAGATLGADPEPPVVFDEGRRVALFASEPLVVHPTGVAIDQHGRVLVVETHTHFRTKDWDGPLHDQLVILEDSDNDGRADSRAVLFDQTDATMDIAATADGWIYLATRNEVLRLRDDDADGVAERVERRIIWLDTDGAHPHNGLSGLAPDGEGGLYFGMGENLGAPYRLVGADGVDVRDGGEGGNVWHCKLDGTGLRRVASGFWNPFGVCVDGQGRVFATDNDPSSRPPCRLHHVVEGGDYGFQYRYGRSGLHPFVSWNGERPGTLGMMAGTGEAPCDVVWFSPERHEAWRGLSSKWQDHLLVASWVDHRIEAYRPIREAGGLKAEREILCRGGADFRPVAMATATDGTLYVTDWVKRNYETHGLGRVWRISAAEPETLGESGTRPTVETREAAAIERIESGPAPSIADALEWLGAEDPHVHHAAIERLAREPPLVKQLAAAWLPSMRQRIGVLLAARRGLKREGITAERMPVSFVPLIERSLRDVEPWVAIEALRWISDERMLSCLESVESLLEDKSIAPQVVLAAVTTIARLEGGDELSEKEIVARVKTRALDPGVDWLQRRTLLAHLQDWGASLTPDEAVGVMESETAEESREWMAHYLGLLGDEASEEVLLALAKDESEGVRARYAALAHLHPNLEDSELLDAALEAEEEVWLASAMGGFVGVPLPSATLTRLNELERATWGQELARLKGQPFLSVQRPDWSDTQGWRRYLRGVDGEPDLQRGRLVFLSSRLGACAGCHRVDGLGRSIGPDLSPLRDQGNVEGVLASILQPSGNVAPQYECFQIETTDKQALTLFRVGEKGGRGFYLDLKGNEIELKIEEIAKRERIPVSIMPEGIVNRLTDREVRDLVYFVAGAVP